MSHTPCHLITKQDDGGTKLCLKTGSGVKVQEESSYS